MKAHIDGDKLIIEVSKLTAALCELSRYAEVFPDAVSEFLDEMRGPSKLVHFLYTDDSKVQPGERRIDFQPSAQLLGFLIDMAAVEIVPTRQGKRREIPPRIRRPAAWRSFGWEPGRAEFRLGFDTPEGVVDLFLSVSQGWKLQQVLATELAERARRLGDPTPLGDIGRNTEP